MIAKGNNLKDFLSINKVQFVIPVYQRNYDWSIVECEQLLSDILLVGKGSENNHFIGSIVYIHDGIYTTSDVKEFVIIDGQQRLTTITLIYLALCHFAKKRNKKDKAEEILNTIIQNQYVERNDQLLKLKQTEPNHSILEYLANENSPHEYKGFSRMVENYIFFKKEINDDNFLNIIKGLEKLLFVEISLERGRDDPQRIFESLNSTGLELTQADLIRNYILMGLAPKMQAQVFDKYWKSIENNAKDEQKNTSRVSDYIRDYLTIQNNIIPNKSKVYKEFKNKYRKRDSYFYTTVLEKIREYAIYYNKLLNPQNEENSKIRVELEAIQQLEINVSYPFLMQVYKDFANNIIGVKTFYEVLRLVQSFTWRRFIVDLGTNALNKIFMTLYSDVDPNNYLYSIQYALMRKTGKQRFPNNEEIKTTLLTKDMYNIKSKNRAYYFEQMEHFRNPEKVNIKNSSITVEHIFPRKPTDEWKRDLTTDEYEKFINVYIHTIANLTLSGNNESLSNKTFHEKKHMNYHGGKQGYIYSNLRINSFLKNINYWNTETFRQRYNQLVEQFTQVWEYPQMTLEDTDETEEYNIFEAPIPTHRTLEYYSFRDNLVFTNIIAEMYTNVIGELFNENPELFISSDLKQDLDITRDQKGLRQSTALGSSFFMEANLSSKRRFEQLKKVLRKFELEDSLIIKYKPK